MWHDIFTAFALYLILEGMIPFISPGNFRKTVARIAAMGDNNLRMSGLVAMAAGLLLLYIVRS
ncbi:DUF2065 domain-containing protein [Woeseia oceani]|nr:DUF2065 domain-containing protein [Woeseia oceani]